MTSIFNYGFALAKDNFQKKKVDLIYLSEYKLLIELAMLSYAFGANQLHIIEALEEIIDYLEKNHGLKSASAK